MPNERLRSALGQAGLSATRLGERLAVDPKTVERWIGGRLPHRRHRQHLAQLLGAEERYLWPDADTIRGAEGGRAELIALYPHRADVPAMLWRQLAAQSENVINVLAYAALFLPEQDPDLVRTLCRKASSGLQVRLLLGDPASDEVRRRGEEEGLGGAMAARIHTALLHYRPLLDAPDVSLRLHKTNLYNSIFRFDEEMLVNTHIWGSNAYRSPVLHLRRLPEATLFDNYLTSFDAVWSGAEPYTDRRSAS